MRFSVFLRFSLLLSLCIIPLSVPVVVSAADEEEFVRARVMEVIEEETRDIAGTSSVYQKVKAEILSGPDKGAQRIIDHGELATVSQHQTVKQGQEVVLRATGQDEYGRMYQILDTYKVPTLGWIVLAFVVLVLVFSRLKGLGSLVGLGISIFVIIRFIVPGIIGGQDPLLISIIGALVMLTSTMYLAHGFSVTTHVAVVSTFIALVITAILSYTFVALTGLTGLGSEEAYSLTLGPLESINFKGLLLGGMILGALGVLDDVTTSQAAAVWQLHAVNTSLGVRELVGRSMMIGKEHVSSMVNTLVLAYAGASMPIFLFFVINPTNQPVWVTLNSEFVIEEIVRTLSGSFGLVLAVPITSLIGAYVVTRQRTGKSRKSGE